MRCTDGAGQRLNMENYGYSHMSQNIYIPAHVYCFVVRYWPSDDVQHVCIMYV